MDVFMGPGKDGIAARGKCRKSGLESKVAVITASLDERIAPASKRAELRCSCPSQCPSRRNVGSIRRLAASMLVPARRQPARRAKGPTGRIGGLILVNGSPDHCASVATNREIAGRLGIFDRTSTSTCIGADLLTLNNRTQAAAADRQGRQRLTFNFVAQPGGL